MTEPLSSHVAFWNGSPALFINGKPDTGLMLYHNTVAVGHDEIADFAEAGIHLLTTGLGSTSCLLPEGSIDPSDADLTMETILAANPQAKVLARLFLTPPEWWQKAYPEEMMLHWDPFLVSYVSGEYDSVSFASERWREEMGLAMRKIIRHLEDKWGDHLLGYHISAGECGEWSYIWRNYTQSDYSKPQQEAFCKWLRARYRNDEQRFSNAWGCSGFDAVEIPMDWRWDEGTPELLTRPEDLPVKEYLIFHSEVVADAILHFSRLAKEELREMDRRKVVAIFYGYHFAPPGNPSAFTDSGHHAISSILDSPDVDILCAPYSYNGREAGGFYYSQLVAGSVRLHGKLVYSEEDTVTHVVPPHAHRYSCPDEWTTRQVILRNVLGALRDGGTAWYMDWFGQNWYNDKNLMASFARTQEFAQQRLQWKTDSVAEVAAFVSAATVHQFRTMAPAVVPWALDPAGELQRIGAPVDFFFFHDLPKLLEQPSPYKLFLFLDVLPESEVELDIMNRAKQSGLSLLFTKPAGIEIPWSEGQCTVPLPLDLSEVREIARNAGVHIYSEDGDFVSVEQHWLSVHAAEEGLRTIHLPAHTTAREAWAGVPAKSVRRIDVTLQKGETRLYFLNREDVG
jgi:beta-galactosidase